jgi:AcrR family transcriptional regulator
VTAATTPTRAELAASQRSRMLRAMSRAVAEKGYAGVTVADVVAAAGVSRRTFYEHFDDKEACFLAAYEAGTQLVIADVLSAMPRLPDGDWRTRAQVALQVYCDALAAQPQFARVFVLDVLGAGPNAVGLRQRVHDMFVAQWRNLAELARREDGIGPIPDLVLQALVGGIGELVQRRIVNEGAHTLGDLAPQLAILAISVIESGGTK